MGHNYEENINFWDNFVWMKRNTGFKLFVAIVINTLRPRLNGRYIADDIFKCIFLNKNVWIPIKISLKFVPHGPINNIQHWLRKWLAADQATSHYLDQWWLDYRHSASMGIPCDNEWNEWHLLPIQVCGRRGMQAHRTWHTMRSSNGNISPHKGQ